jgi:molybdenum cofactor cytidylyltransferase
MPATPYQGAILEHFRRPRNYGSLPNAAAEAEGSNPLCGDRVRVAIALDATGERIETARFTANACAICIASASVLTERMTGATCQSIGELAEDDVVTALGAEIPPARRRCALLPLEAARCALETVKRSRLHRAGPLVETVAGVLLAAGSARRFGGTQKLLAELPNGDQTRASLVELAAVQLHRAGLRRLVVVVGRDGERVRERLQDCDVEVVRNAVYAQGMSTSVITGVTAALERWPESGAILIALGDQPLLDERIVPGIVRAFDPAVGARIVAPRYRGVRGNPVMFSRELTDELLGISGDQGARAVVERDPKRVLYVDFDLDAPIDVDTPDDTVRLARALAARGTEA